jgi:phosphatidylinositol dimannoside acyltransferase
MPEVTPPGRSRRIGISGDLPQVFILKYGLRITPWFLEPILIGSWATLFFLLGKKHRQGVVGNLRALHPAWSQWRSWLGAWQVFVNFAITYIDALRCQTQTGGVDWAVAGLATMAEISARRDGCIILTAHMGNYDLAAPLFAEKFKRTLYTVRAEEQQPEMQKLRELEIEKNEANYPNFRSLFNRPDNLLGVELNRLLGEGAIVAVQGDRVVFDVSPMDVEVEPGLWLRLPKGPLFLARVSSAPVYPLYIVRDGWRRYRVIVMPELILPARQRGADDAARQIWAAVILQIIRENWRQWYVFEPLLMRLNPDAI